jgi:hypothetical protein
VLAPTALTCAPAASHRCQRPAAASDDDDLHLGRRRQLAQRAGDARGGVAVLDRREGPDEPSAPAPPPQPGQDVVPRLAALARDDADRLGQQGALQPLLGLEQALGMQSPAQALHRHQQVALAGDAQLGHGEAE